MRSIAAGHNACNTIDIDLLGNVAGLDDFLLAAHRHQSFLPDLPPVLLHPTRHAALLYKSKQFSEYPLLDRLIGDADDVANKLSYGIFKPHHRGGQLRLAVDLLPENLELAHLQQDLLGKETLAKDKVSVGQIGESLQKNLHNHPQV